MTSFHDSFAELAGQLRSMAEANSNEAKGCVAGEELRKAASQGAAQAFSVAAEMIDEKVRWQRRIGSGESKEPVRLWRGVER